MIRIDARTGSKELAPHFNSYGIDVELCHLPFGDLSWEGNGPTGVCTVTVERKIIGELVQSMESRRLSGHQLPGMAADYDYCYLIVEGLWRASEQGVLEVGHGNLEAERFGGRWVPAGFGKRQMLYRAVDNYLATLELRAGLIYRRTWTTTETVAVIVDLYHWWKDKLWEEHRSHQGVYAPAEPVRRRGRIQLVKREVTLAEKWAMQLPGLDARAREVAEVMGSARALANATEAEWLGIRGVGKVTAGAAVRLINEEI